ncbi:aldehyde dehydrogenase family protein [Youxingia wuxianensis]|nr:aldehyde dehydrogenase family protein [Youxingia wuxianensis]
MSFYLNGYAYGSNPAKRSTVDIKNPVTREVMGTLPLAEGNEDAERVLSYAEEGLAIWENTPLYRRAQIMNKFADLLEKNEERVAETLCRNMGRPISECHGEVSLTVALTRGYVEKANHEYGEVMPQNQPGLENDIIFTRREPLGVCMCIVPFNAPVELFAHKTVPALLMGNSVIAKMPSSDPMPILIMADLLTQAGVPHQTIQLLYASGKFVSQYINKSPRIAAITFTGSTQVGRAVYEDSAPQLHRVFLEMGGNDPLILTEDADLDYAADQLVSTRTLNGGQVCCSSKRTLVPDTIADAFVEKVKARIAKVRQGNPLDPRTELGSLINAEAAAEVKRQIDETVRQGAICVCGGEIKDDVFLTPTLLDGVTSDMDVAKNMEIFGPVMTIIRYHSIEEAIEIANQTEYGLQAGIIAKDATQGIAIGARIKAGMVVVNGAGSYRHMDMPFGGFKNSGIGREGIAITLEEFSQPKCYVMKNVLNSVDFSNN